MPLSPLGEGCVFPLKFRSEGERVSRMSLAVVVGGGRWGRVIASKLTLLGFDVRVATDHPTTPGDIARSDIACLVPRPELVYVASRSVDHERDFDLVASLETEIWVEKNFIGMSDSLLARFNSGQNFVFSQQLFNTSIDRYANELKRLSEFHISTEVDRRIESAVGLFDWLCHDLSLISRIVRLRAEPVPLAIACTVNYSEGTCIATYVINQIPFRVELNELRRKFRRVRLAGGASLVSGNDGVLWRRDSDGQTDAPDPSGTTNDDLLGRALRFALESPRDEAYALTQILLQLQRASFPLIEPQNYVASAPTSNSLAR